MNKQLLHYYFGSREGLYQALLSDAGTQVAASMGQIRLIGLTAVERLRRLLGAQFDLLARERELTQLLLQAPGPAAWADTAASPLVGLLTEGQATGFFRDDIDPTHHARQAMVLHLGYFALEPITRAWAGPATWRDRTTELVVRGCTW